MAYCSIVPVVDVAAKMTRPLALKAMQPAVRGTAKGSKKRSYTREFKRDVIDFYRDNRGRTTYAEVGAKYKISGSTVKSFWANRGQIEKNADDRKRVRKCAHPELESQLLDFIQLASNGWLYNFLRRSHIGPSVRLHGQAGSVDKDAVRADMVAFSTKIARYHPCRLYNMDESGFLYQSLPNVSYLAPGEDRPSARGVKANRAKDRITFAASTNATGSHVVPLFFIGKSKSPKCFSLASSLERLKKWYRSQTNSWMQTQLFEYYLMECWYPAVRKETGENVCLILDNCSAHGEKLPVLPGVEYVFLPPGVTSIYQPLDQGIIAAIKANARREVLQQVVNNVESAEELRELGSKQKNGMRGLKYCYPAHVLDGIRALNFGLRQLDAYHISNYWIASDILAPEQIKNVFESNGFQPPCILENTPGFEAGDKLGLNTGFRLALAEDDCSAGNVMGPPPESSNEMIRSVLNDDTLQPDIIGQWIQNCESVEERPALEAERDPGSIIETLDKIAEEIQAEEEQLRQEEDEEDNLADVSAVDIHKKACEDLQWISEIVEQGKDRCLSGPVQSLLIEALRVTRKERRDSAPAQRQTSLVDFFCK
eukprot:IDg1152t1